MDLVVHRLSLEGGTSSQPQPLGRKWKAGGQGKEGVFTAYHFVSFDCIISSKNKYRKLWENKTLYF